MRNIIRLEDPRGWAETVIEILKGKIAKEAIYDTGSLYESVTLENVLMGNPIIGMSSAEFSFSQYGLYVEAGVGKGGNSRSKQRRPWQAATMFREVAKLTEFISNKYAITAVNTIKENLEK